MDRTFRYEISITSNRRSRQFRCTMSMHHHRTRNHYYGYVRQTQYFRSDYQCSSYVRTYQEAHIDFSSLVRRSTLLGRCFYICTFSHNSFVHTRHAVHQVAWETTQNASMNVSKHRTTSQSNISEWPSRWHTPSLYIQDNRGCSRCAIFGGHPPDSMGKKSYRTLLQ